MEHGFFSTKGNRILGAITLVMVILALASFTILNLNRAEQAALPATITVEGTGEVVAVPDIGTFSFTVEAKAATAEEAQSQSAETMNTILSQLKNAGVDENDIKTANYNLFPNYRYEERVCAFGGYCPPGERVQDGFTVSQSVSVKVRETDKAGELIAGVGERGATNISGLNFTIDDVDALRSEAQDKAIKNARAKAETLADSLGVRITKLSSYYENTPYYGYDHGGSFEVEARAFSLESAPELPVGEETTSVTVNVTYEVR